MPNDIRSTVLLTPQQLSAMMAQNPRLVIVAVQSINPYTGASSWDAPRIPGAIDTDAYADFAAPKSATEGQRPLPAIADLQISARRWGLHPEDSIVVYDNDRSMTAARAWWVLRWAGLTDVRVLDGGLPAWRAANLPTTPEPRLLTPSNIVLTAGHMPELDAARSLALAREGVLLDARIRPNYIGGNSEPGQPPRGHIPGAISAPAPDNVTDYGNFTDSATLAELYRGAGIDPSGPVGVYCGAGMSAAHSVLALASIGISAAMYPGSWSAYVSDADLPIARGASPG